MVAVVVDDDLVCVTDDSLETDDSFEIETEVCTSVNVVTETLTDVEEPVGFFNGVKLFPAEVEEELRVVVETLDDISPETASVDVIIADVFDDVFLVFVVTVLGDDEFDEGDEDDADG